MAEYIEKQAAIEAFENKAHLEWEYLRIAMPLLKTLEAIPTADVVQVVHGRWVKEYWHGETTRRCSVCNITQTVTVYKDDVKFKYCPYCGAKNNKE